VTLIGYRLVFRRGHPLFSPRFNVPTAKAIDAALISGAVIFGIGWGLAGYCPGPAVVSLPSGRPEVFVFVTAMIAGMTAVRWMRARPAALPKALGKIRHSVAASLLSKQNGDTVSMALKSE
jgi:uncharacterized membrane protein YedE/YeeE